MQDFYSIRKSDIGEESSEFIVDLNPEHRVYAGHFPEQDVAPGVMLTQMTKELCEKVYSRKFLLSEARNIKFLAPVIPDNFKGIQVNIKHKAVDDKTNIAAVAVNGEQKLFKINALLTSIS